MACRFESAKWTWPRCGATPRSAPAMSVSSMFMWKRSHSSFTFLRPRSSRNCAASAARVKRFVS
jgi:hypothetical protein